MLRRRDLGEADRILTLFTPDHGKLRATAKGIRKPRSRKAGHLELFTRTALLIHKGRDLDVITQAQLVDAHRPLREDLLRGAYAAYAVELLDRFTPERQEHRDMYDLLRRALTWIDRASDLGLAARFYELRLLGLAGFQPELRRCAVCGQPIVAEDQFYSVHDGGAVGAKCGRQPRPGLVPVSQAALKYLRYFQANSYAKASAVSVMPAVLNEMEQVLRGYITYLLERQLKSVEFLNLIRREAA